MQVKNSILLAIVILTISKNFVLCHIPCNHNDPNAFVLPTVPKGYPCQSCNPVTEVIPRCCWTYSNLCNYQTKFAIMTNDTLTYTFASDFYSFQNTTTPTTLVLNRYNGDTKLHLCTLSNTYEETLTLYCMKNIFTDEHIYANEKEAGIIINPISSTVCKHPPNLNARRIGSSTIGRCPNGIQSRKYVEAPGQYEFSCRNSGVLSKYSLPVGKTYTTFVSNCSASGDWIVPIPTYCIRL